MPGTDPISTAVIREGSIAVVTVAGDIDLATVPALEAAIAEAVTGKPAALIIDLTGVEFLASAGLQSLVAARENVGASAEFAIVADGPATSRPIELTGLDQLLALHPPLAEAKAAVGDGSG